MENLENQELSVQEQLKNFRTPEKVQIPGSLLYTPMRSYYKTHDYNSFVRIRIIDLTVPGEATISIQALNTWYSEVVDRDKAIACVDMFDIILENGKYQFVLHKIIDEDGVPVRLETCDLPPRDAETGIKNKIVRHTPRNTRTNILGKIDVVTSRTLYHFEDRTSKLVVKTKDNDIFEDDVTGEEFGEFLVPGDFVVYKLKANMNFVNGRIMEVEDHIYEVVSGIPNLNP